MSILTIISVVALTALVHASFQLGVSVITLLSGTSAGKHATPSKVLRLVSAFTGGTIIMIALILCTLLYLIHTINIWGNPPFLWTIVCGILIGVGLTVWTLYYRRGSGTRLWIPRNFADFLNTRVRHTTLAVEAFSLGLTAVIAEIPLTIAPLTAAALALTYLTPVSYQVLGALGYIILASLGILIITVLIGSGHNISRIQRWRESNKRFLQFAAGSGLIILGLFLYVSQVISVVFINTAGGQLW